MTAPETRDPALLEKLDAVAGRVLGRLERDGCSQIAIRALAYCWSMT